MIPDQWYKAVFKMQSEVSVMKKNPKKQKSQPIYTLTNFNVHYILIFQLKVVFVASAFSLAHNQIRWRFGTLV